MREESGNNFISLREAAEYTGYSQEYLNLRVRQGKLKGVKIGRNWATTREWMDEYTERANNYKNQRAKRKKEKAIPPTSPFTATPTPFQPGSRAWSVAIILALVFVLGSVATFFAYPHGGPILKEVATDIRAAFTKATASLMEITSDIGKGAVVVSRSISENTASIKDQLSQYISQDIKAIKKFTKEIPATVLGTLKKVPEKVQIKDLEVLEKIQVRDQVTGKIYCTWLENGDWVKVKGECEQRSNK